MQRFIVISTTAICAAVLSASPISVNWPAGKAVSVTQDKANPEVGRPLTASVENARGPRRSPLIPVHPFAGESCGSGAAWPHAARS